MVYSWHCFHELPIWSIVWHQSSIPHLSSCISFIIVKCNVAGASNCYWISKYFAGNVVRNKFGKEFEQVSQKIAKHNDDLFLFMISSRIFPGSPNWLMNISFPHIKSIKYSWYCASIAIGLIPWNFMTCQAGIFVMNF